MENYFEDILSLVGLKLWQLLWDFRLLVAVVKYFYGLSRLNRLLLFMILGCYNCGIRA